jgi:hypothetical protein
MRGIAVRRTTLWAAALLLLVPVACTPVGRSGSAGQSAELLNNKCTVCHPIDRINKESKDRAGWEQTVTRMRAHGAVLSDSEAAQIVDYLSGARK